MLNYARYFDRFANAEVSLLLLSILSRISDMEADLFLHETEKPIFLDVFGRQWPLIIRQNYDSKRKLSFALNVVNSCFMTPRRLSLRPRIATSMTYCKKWRGIEKWRGVVRNGESITLSR